MPRCLSLSTSSLQRYITNATMGPLVAQQRSLCCAMDVLSTKTGLSIVTAMGRRCELAKPHRAAAPSRHQPSRRRRSYGAVSETASLR